MSLGSLVAACLASLLALAFAITGRLDWAAALAIVAMSVVIVYRHEGNIRRLRAGTERRVGQTVDV
jgi:glycerol-3-phosphate acyltransferase PlsY